jgi:uncharacterized protein
MVDRLTFGEMFCNASRTLKKTHALYAMIAMIILGGCVSSPPPRFYTLSPVTSQGGIGSTALKGPRSIIAIAPIEIPDYLDRPEIVTRSSHNRLSLAESDLWGGSLKADIHRVLTENLSTVLSADGFTIVSWKPGMPIQYRVTVHVTRFDIKPGNNILLAAQWTVSGKDGKSNLMISNSSFTEYISSDDLTTAVSGMSSALGKLSGEIARKVRSLKGEAVLPE